MAVDRGFEPRLGQTKTVKLVFAASQILVHKSKDRLAWNQDNVSRVE